MRYSSLLLVVLCSFATGLKAQYIRLMTSDSLPAASVRIVLSALPKGKTETVLITDTVGRAMLPTDGYPYRLTVQLLIFEKVRDTIGSAHNKTVWLVPKELSMGEVVITGQYKPTNTDNAIQRIEVIDRKKIDAMAAQNLRDVLTNQLEIRLEYDPIFGTSMNMQGSKNYGAGAKILIDGVPVSGKQNGSVDLSQINLANIERIEIIKGPMSVSYGTDAVAGTVNLITKKTVKRTWEATANSYYESIGTYNINVGGGVRLKKHSLRFDGFRNFFGGWNPGNGLAFFDFTPRLADTSRVMLWKPREQYQGCVQYVYTHRKTTVNYKGSYFFELITNRGAPMQPYYEMAFDNRFHTYRKDNALFVNTDVAEGKHINVFAAYNAYKRVKNEAANDLTTLRETLDPQAQDTSKYDEVNSRGVYAAANSNKKLNYEIGYDISIQYANSTQIEDRKQQMGNYALFGSAEYRPTERFTVRPGLRYGYNTRYTAPMAPSVNFMYKAGEVVTLRASYARGFRQPGLKDLYFDFVDINHNIHGNPNLKAEYSDNYLAAAGYNGKLEKVNFKANISVFYNNVQDLITLVLKANGTANEYWYENIDRFVTKGMQGNVEVSVKAFNISAGGSYLGTFNQMSKLPDVPAFSYSPEVRGSVMYNMIQTGISISFFYKYTGRSVIYISDAVSSSPVQSVMSNYHIADMTASKQLFHKHVNVYAGCKNLFDVRNIASNQIGGAHSGGGGTTAIGMGRYFFVKTEIKLSR